MSAYIVAGYVIALSTLSAYAATLVARLRAAKRRLRLIEEEDRADAVRGGGLGSAADIS